MERRILIAFVLSFLVLYLYQALLPQPAPAPEAEPGSTPQTIESQTVTPATPPPQAVPAPPAPAAETPAAILADAAERDVTLETNLIEAVFTNRGGVLKAWRLKNFRDSDGELHDMIPQGIAEELGRPFRLGVEDPALATRLNTALFSVEQRGPGRVQFRFEDASGLRASKTFSLEADSYLLSVDVSATLGGQSLEPAIDWGPALGPLVEPESQYTQRSAGIVFVNGDVERIDAGDIARQSRYSGGIEFGGVDDQYFLSAFIRPGAAELEYRALTVPSPVAGDDPFDLVAYSVRPDPEAGPARVFVGPKDFDVLRAIDQNLVRAINFGWLAWLIVPLLTSLKWLNGFIGNYGWSIIALTILINALMFPLRHKSVVSMRKMQELQPEVKAIQERYSKLKATDPAKQKMNTEMMALYRERGVNPASGCVPMILMMPVLFAFYRLLSVAVELRGAPFFGWITDLSGPDPLYITPVLMGATMVLQQRMTPSTMDPLQQKMMMFMPVVFTFMFLRAPSGLVLYWLVSNLWAIGQQHVTNRIIGPTPVHQVRPPAERKLKKAGAGKTEAAGKDEAPGR